MIEESARVVSSDGVSAVVEARRMSACGRCGTREGCGTSMLAGLFGQRAVRVRVHNPIGARPGDQVIVGLSESLFTRASLLLYLLPLLSLILFAIAGQWLAHHLGVMLAEPWSILSGLLGLALGLCWARYHSGAVSAQVAGQAVILRPAKEGARVKLGLS